MLSITDIKDFIDLDRETVFIVTGATGLSPEESTLLARQLLASEQGLAILHHMFLDQIAAAADDFSARPGRIPAGGLRLLRPQVSPAEPAAAGMNAPRRVNPAQDERLPAVPRGSLA